jgi:hypothetical protein
MVDLSHWDFAETFKAKEAVELIIGIPPELNTQVFGVMGDDAAQTAKITPILRRMKDAYDQSWYRFEGELIGAECGFEAVLTSAIELRSELLLKCRKHKRKFDVSRVFESQDFHRNELKRWLDAIGMNSVYQFDLSHSETTQLPTVRWPWGNHHTEMLGHLEAAALRYWVQYDQSDATTAPTNKDVAEWLVSERKLSQKMAESIASILRTDGLATGPRK